MQLWLFLIRPQLIRFNELFLLCNYQCWQFRITLISIFQHHPDFSVSVLISLQHYFARFPGPDEHTLGDSLAVTIMGTVRFRLVYFPSSLTQNGPLGVSALYPFVLSVLNMTR